MSLKPIDLQNLFVRLNQVSKDQAAQQQAQLHAQQVAGQEIEESTLQKDNKVNKTEELEQGPEQVSDDKEKRQAQTNQQQKQEKEEQTEKEQQKKKTFDDPDLGQKIDIMG